MHSPAGCLSLHKLAWLCRLSPPDVCPMGRHGHNGHRSLAVLALSYRPGQKLGTQLGDASRPSIGPGWRLPFDPSPDVCLDFIVRSRAGTVAAKLACGLVRNLDVFRDV